MRQELLACCGAFEERSASGVSVFPSERRARTAKDTIGCPRAYRCRQGGPTQRAGESLVGFRKNQRQEILLKLLALLHSEVFKLQSHAIVPGNAENARGEQERRVGLHL